MPWKLAMKRVRISLQEEIVSGARFRSQVRAILERHGEPIRHDLLVSVGGYDAQLIELQELRGVRCAIIAGREVRLELAWPCDAAQLGGEGEAARCGHRRPLLVLDSFLQVTTCRH